MDITEECYEIRSCINALTATNELSQQLMCIS